MSRPSTESGTANVPLPWVVSALHRKDSCDTGRSVLAAACTCNGVVVLLWRHGVRMHSLTQSQAPSLLCAMAISCVRTHCPRYVRAAGQLRHSIVRAEGCSRDWDLVVVL